MTLIDTSVWIDHFRHGDDRLADLIDARLAATHDFVIGELACGNLRVRGKTLNDLNALPRLETASTPDVALMLEQNKLYGLGLGWIDMHLLAATVLAHATLYTRDQSLGAAAKRLGVASTV
jgi:predicted nucleic acid-binding protein